MKIDKNSWHFKVATRYMGVWDKENLIDHGTDVCSYIRSITFSLFLTALMSAVGSLAFSVFILPSLFWFIYGLNNGFAILDVWDIVYGTMIIWLPITFWLFWNSGKAVDVVKSVVGVPIKDTSSFKTIVTHYWKFKNKYCTRIEIV